MSTENNLWMGDIEAWMTESFIIQAFNHYNINPSGVKLIKNRETNTNKNYCFINFSNIKDANSTLSLLNGKIIPGTSIKFKLNWANYYSSFNKSVYVGNLTSDVDDICLYNLFKNRYNSVHHASVISDKGKSKGFGFVMFRNEEEYENCLKEMNGILFHGNNIKVNEQKKKEDNEVHNNNNETNIRKISDNNTNNIQNIFNDNMNVNNINDLLHSTRNNLYRQILNNNINNINNVNSNINTSINTNINNKYNDTNNSIINDLRKNSNNINQYNLKNNNISNKNSIINNNINSIINSNINNINNIQTFSELNLANLNVQKNFNQIQNIGNQDFMNINVNNLMSFYPRNLNDSDINNRNLTNLNISMNSNQYKNNIDFDQNLEILNNYDDVTLYKKIRENLDKTYRYYSCVYPGDKNKLKCKSLIFNKYIFFSSFKYVYLLLPSTK